MSDPITYIQVGSQYYASNYLAAQAAAGNKIAIAALANNGLPSVDNQGNGQSSPTEDIDSDGLTPYQRYLALQGNVAEGGGQVHIYRKLSEPEQANLNKSLRDAVDSAHDSEKQKPSEATKTTSEVTYYNTSGKGKPTYYTPGTKWFKKDTEGNLQELPEGPPYDPAWEKNPPSDTAKPNQVLINRLKSEFALRGILYRPEVSATEQLKEIPIVAGEMLVPGVYSARHWSEMSGGEKAFSIAMDALTVTPITKAAGAGAREVSTAGRMARLKGGATGIGREFAAQARAPVDVLIDPKGTIVGSAKQTREFVENIARPGKIPEAVITTSEGTVRLRVSEATTPEQAKQIRDDLMRAASKGESITIKTKDAEYGLARSPLMKEAGGGLAHATPSGESFIEGATVSPKPGMPPTEQGLFMSHEPLPKFVKASAFGKTGDRPTIIIMSPEQAKNAIPTGKIYRGTTEMELKMPVGYKLPPPKQVLMTRINGDRVDIYLDKRLSFRQIAKLKAIAAVEDLKAPFKPAITIKNINGNEARILAKEIDIAGNAPEVGRNLRRIDGNADRFRASPRPLSTIIGARRVDRQEPPTRSNGRASERQIEQTRLNRVDTTRQESTRDEARTSERETGRTQTTRTETPTPERIPPPIRTPNPPDRIPPPPERIPPPPERRPPDPDRPPDPPPPGKPPPPIILPPDLSKRRSSSGGTSKPEQAGKVLVKPGTIAWQQGELEVDKSRPGNEPVIKFIEPPYNKVDTLFVYPNGYDNKGKTPKASIQVIGGKAKENVDVSMGATTAHVKANQEEVAFTKNPIRITEDKGKPEKGKPRNKGKFKFSKRKGNFYRDIGGGIVVDRRGRHLKLF